MILDYVNIIMDFNALSQGQVQSKIWLCKNLEPYIYPDSTILNLGCWYNLLGFMLCTRNNVTIKSIHGIDKDCEAIKYANIFCSAFMMQPDVRIMNECKDVNEVNYNGYDVVINCSVEHIDNNEWFNKINNNTLVCLQTSNRVTDDPMWDIKNPNPNFDVFKNKFPLSSYYIQTTYNFQYDEYGYDRFMIIGRK